MHRVSTMNCRPCGWNEKYWTPPQAIWNLSVFEPIRNCINSSISTGTFPDELKIADIVLLFKKEDPNDKANYRPINLLPLIAKIFEKFLY